MEVQSRQITSEEYAKEYLPGPGFVLIHRDQQEKIVNGLLIPQTTRDRSARMAGTGVIKVKSPMPPHESQDRKLWEYYEIGDRVCFDATVPFLAPAPPNYRFRNPDNEDDNSVTIHIADISGMICSDEESKQRKIQRAGDIWK